MKFIKNIIVPLTIIIIMTKLVIAFYPMWKLESITFLILGALVFGSSIFSFYYIFCHLYPDERNPEMPPQIIMLLKMRKNEKLDKKQMTKEKKTVAFNLTAIFSMLFTCYGYYLWSVLPEKYLNYKIDENGIKTVGVVVSSTRHKNDMGNHKTYTFFDLSGNKYTNYTKDDNLNVGDSVNILYFKENPEKHKVWRKR